MYYCETHIDTFTRKYLNLNSGNAIYIYIERDFFLITYIIKYSCFTRVINIYGGHLWGLHGKTTSQRSIY